MFTGFILGLIVSVFKENTPNLSDFADIYFPVYSLCKACILPLLDILIITVLLSNS